VIKKKGPIVADRAMKVWERMPERHTLYADVYVMLQARSMRRWLSILQLILLIVVSGARREHSLSLIRVNAL
jgi:hypothetical protein